VRNNPRPDHFSKPLYRSAQGFQRLLFFITVWAALCGVGTASSVKTINLPEMTNIAGVVFYGRCLAVETVTPSGFPAQRYTFQVIEALKGVEADQIVTFQQITGSGLLRIPGMPVYQKGQELLLFLYPDSRFGLTSPVGMGQGSFRPKELSDGEIGFVNSFGNRNLSTRLDETPDAASGLSQDQLDLLLSMAPISLATMTEMVAQLQQVRIDDEANK